MAVRVIKKSLAGSEDLLLGFGTELQVRNDKNIEITKINASNIPYNEDTSIAEFLDKATKKVDTLAALRSMTETFDTIWVSGYYTKDDGAFGSHFFRLKGLKTTETDNSGTVIIVSVGGSDYVYELQYSGVVNVKWFGAKGDSITNDLISVQNALYYIRSTQDILTSWYSDKVDSILLFTDGTYLIDGTVLSPGNVTIKGDGASIISNNNDTTPVFETCYIDSGVWISNEVLTNEELFNDAVTNLVFSNITFRNIGLVFKLKGSLWSGCIKDCSFYYCGQVVIAESCFYFNYLDIRVTGTKSSYFDDKAKFELKNNVNRISFDRVSIGGISSITSKYGIGISISGGGTGLSITNCALEEMGIGVQFTDTFNDFKIDSTYIEGVAQVLIDTDGAIKRGFTINIPSGLLVSDLVNMSGLYNSTIYSFRDSKEGFEYYRGVVKLYAGTNNNKGTTVYQFASISPVDGVYRINTDRYLVTSDVKLIPNDASLVGNVEHGSNANGKYIKFSNGTQICYGMSKSLTCSTSITSPYGTTAGVVYRPADTEIYYPAAFISTPSVVGSLDGHNIANAGYIQTNYFVPRVSSVTSGSVLTPTYIAVGRWK